MFFSNLSVKTFLVTELISDAQLITTVTILTHRVNTRVANFQSEIV